MARRDGSRLNRRAGRLRRPSDRSAPLAVRPAVASAGDGRRPAAAGTTGRREPLTPPVRSGPRRSLATGQSGGSSAPGTFALWSGTSGSAGAPSGAGSSATRSSSSSTTRSASWGIRRSGSLSVTAHRRNPRSGSSPQIGVPARPVGDRWQLPCTHSASLTIARGPPRRVLAEARRGVPSGELQYPANDGATRPPSCGRRAGVACRSFFPPCRCANRGALRLRSTWSMAGFSDTNERTDVTSCRRARSPTSIVAVVT